MDMMDKVVRLPKVNERIGSCPECGAPIWESFRMSEQEDRKVYRCIECKYIALKSAIIPF